MRSLILRHHRIFPNLDFSSVLGVWSANACKKRMQLLHGTHAASHLLSRKVTVRPVWVATIGKSSKKGKARKVLASRQT